MVKLNLLRDELKQGYQVGVGDRSIAVTGEPFVALSGSGGEDEARSAFREYEKGKKGRLYWRTTPEANDVPSFYMRLLISEK